MYVKSVAKHGPPAGVGGKSWREVASRVSSLAIHKWTMT
ncbi:hypothetical protein AVEN_232328-1, partial [Araneus ventricosus]